MALYSPGGDGLAIKGDQKTRALRVDEKIQLVFSAVENLWPISFDPVQVVQILVKLAYGVRQTLDD